MKDLEKSTVSTLEVEVSIKTLDRKSGRLVDFFETKAKAIKLKTSEDSIVIKDDIEIKIDEFDTLENAAFPSVFARCGSKLTKADAGIV